MTDRELLEAAARAAGITGTYDTERLCIEGDWEDVTAIFFPDGMGYWNPLTDDGDALRLAVQLRMVIEIGRDATLVYQDDPGICQLHESDPAAATRRAIVWFAATKAGQGELVLPNA